jgi:membrane-bound serine protease (ClpP class)
MPGRNLVGVARYGESVTRRPRFPAIRALGALLALLPALAIVPKVAALEPVHDALAGAGLPVALLTSPVVSGVLLAIGFVGLLLEMQTLHLVAGVVGIAALALFFGSHVLLGGTDAIVVAVAVFGVLGILFELHVVPGHGLAGILGACALLASVVLVFGAAGLPAAAEALSIAVVLCVLLFAVAARVFPRNAFLYRIAFLGVQGADYVAAPDQRALLGQSGFATSFLRPSGVAAIGGRRVDVLTEGEFVPAGTPVRVTRVEGARVFVRPEVT